LAFLFSVATGPSPRETTYRIVLNGDKRAGRSMPTRERATKGRAFAPWTSPWPASSRCTAALQHRREHRSRNGKGGNHHARLQLNFGCALVSGAVGSFRVVRSWLARCSSILRSRTSSVGDELNCQRLVRRSKVRCQFASSGNNLIYSASSQIESLPTSPPYEAARGQVGCQVKSGGCEDVSLAAATLPHERAVSSYSTVSTYVVCAYTYVSTIRRPGRAQLY